MLKPAFFLLSLVCIATLYSGGLIAAEQTNNEPVTAASTAPGSEPSTEVSAAATDNQDASSEAMADAAPPQDTLDGAGLKEKKLGDIFEQFVPTETISADNAVPFPVDI